MDQCMVVCLKLDFREIIGVRIILCMYLQSRYIKKDSLYVETFDEVEGAHLRACSETSREKITKHLLKNFTVLRSCVVKRRHYKLIFWTHFCMFSQQN